MSGAPQFPDPLGAREVYRPGATQHKAGPDLPRKVLALEQGALARPGPGVANGSVITSDTSQTGGVGWVYPAVPPGIVRLRAMGVSVLSATMDPVQATAGLALTDGQVDLQAVYLPHGATITGIGLVSHTAASFTPDNNCKVGIYTKSGSTFTRVAQSVNNTAIFTQAAGTYFGVSLSANYVATPGIYYIAILANWSAVVTAPSLHGSGIATVATGLRMLGLSIGEQASLSGQSDLPASSSSFATSRTNTYFATLIG